MSMRSKALLLAAIAFATPAVAQDQAAAEPAEAPRAGGGADLAQQLSNPISSLISVPFQHNIDCCFGPEDGVRYTLNIQPVVPVSLSDDWNVIVRTVLPIVYQEETVAGQGDAFGLGDTVQSFFFSPKEPSGGLIWGAGPVFLYPTGGSDLGSKRWGAGPTVVLLKQAQGGVTYGMLANHLWSFGGDSTRPDISNTLLQPFLSKAWPDSTTLSINTETTHDWIRDTWTVPVNFGVSRIYKVGEQPVQIGAQGRYYLSSPTGGPEWGARLAFTLLFPG